MQSISTINGNHHQRLKAVNIYDKRQSTSTIKCSQYQRLKAVNINH